MAAKLKRKSESIIDLKKPPLHLIILLSLFFRLVKWHRNAITNIQHAQRFLHPRPTKTTSKHHPFLHYITFYPLLGMGEKWQD